MPVTTTNCQYDEYIKKWIFIRNIIDDTCRGLIKYQDSPELYTYNSKEYKACVYRTTVYQNCGALLPVTERTRDGLVGLQTQKESKYELPEQLKYILEDCTGTGVGLEQFKNQLLSEAVSIGRYIVLVDYPQTDAKLTKEQNKKYKVNPRFYFYDAESLIDWKTDTILGSEVVTQIRLKEVTYQDDPNDEFAKIRKEQIRVLRLRMSEDGLTRRYSVQLYDTDSRPIKAEKYPINNKGKEFSYIPLFVGGAKENGVKINKPPLLQMAKLNYIHLENSCAHQWYVKLAGSGTLFISTKLTQQDWVEFNGDRTLYLGAGEGYHLGESGNATLLQAPDTNAHLESMNKLEEQMRMVGGDMITSDTPDVTAYATKINNMAKVSPLITTIINLEMLLSDCIVTAADFLGIDLEKEGLVDLNKDVIPEGSDIALIATELTGIAEKVTSVKQVRNNWRHKYKLLPENLTDQELDKEIAQEEHSRSLPDAEFDTAPDKVDVSTQARDNDKIENEQLMIENK